MEKWIGKIKKLLALGGSANENEAAAAMAKASALMAQYQLSLADIELSTGENADAVGEHDVDMSTSAGVSSAHWLRTLAQSCATMFDCRLVLYRGRASKARLVFIGYPQDSAAAQLLYEYLLDSWRKGVAVDMQPAKRDHDKNAREYNTSTVGTNPFERCTMQPWRAGDTRRFRSSHGRGYANRVHARVVDLVRARNMSVRNASATAGALVVTRQQSVSTWLKEHGFRSRTSATRPVSSGAGYRAGAKAGDSVDLGGASSKVSGAPLRLR